jgi:hypothetical protein
MSNQFNDGFFDEDKINENKNIPKCCKGCPNYKKGGFCNCTLPALESGHTGGETGSIEYRYSDGTYEQDEQIING